MQRSLLFIVLTIWGCHASPPAPAQEPSPGAVFLTGAGDIAACGEPGSEATARLLDRIPGRIFTTGDNAYPAGSASDYAYCFEPTWGRHRERIRPTPGNHDYWTAGARPYFEYFGDAAGAAGKGWYTYEYGDWRVVALNSNLYTEPNSEQLRWLRALLADDDHVCTVAYFHHPLVSSGGHGSNSGEDHDADVRALWGALYAAGAELVMAGHDHHYERFAPMAPTGQVDRERGMRLFIVGTGGGRLRGVLDTRHPASEVVHTGAHGVLRLELRDGGYGWAFLSADGEVLDRGEDRCH